jgi:hypothetical protein
MTMLKRWTTTISRRWQVITGAIAVSLMFFVPITRAVFAGGKSNDKDKAEAAKKGASGAKKPAKSTGPKTPANPSPKSTGRNGKPKGK